MQNSTPVESFLLLDFGEDSCCSSASSCDMGKTKSSPSLRPKPGVWQFQVSKAGLMTDLNFFLKVFNVIPFPTFCS